MAWSDRHDNAGSKPLLAGTLVAVGAGIVAGALAGDAALLQSNVVFRLAVGGAVFLAAYVVLVAIWLAAQGRTFSRLGLFGASAETDSATAIEIGERDREVAEFMGGHDEGDRGARTPAPGDRARGRSADDVPDPHEKGEDPVSDSMNERRTVSAYVARMRELTKSVTERNAKIHSRVLDANGNQRTERSRRPRSAG